MFDLEGGQSWGGVELDGGAGLDGGSAGGGAGLEGFHLFSQPAALFYVKLLAPKMTGAPLAGWVVVSPRVSLRVFLSVSESISQGISQHIS